jgi:hypothetical protein
MNNVRVELLRHKIALYRRYMAEGVDGDLAQVYLGEILNAEAELAEIENVAERRR